MHSRRSLPRTAAWLWTPKAKKTTSQPKIARMAPPSGKPKAMGGRNKPAVMPEVGPFLCLPPSLSISQGQEPELKDQGNQDQARVQSPESPTTSRAQPPTPKRRQKWRPWGLAKPCLLPRAVGPSMKLHLHYWPGTRDWTWAPGSPHPQQWAGRQTPRAQRREAELLFSTNQNLLIKWCFFS